LFLHPAVADGFPFDPVPPPGPSHDALAALVERLAADSARLRGLACLRGGGPWTTRLLVSDELEVKLVGWGARQATRAHDHAGATSAWAVLDGELVEDRFAVPAWRGSRVRTRLAPGRTSVLGPGRVHVLANPGAGAALSVHAASPPRLAARFHFADAASFLAEAAPWS
jgi:predicted metal-dependent enzyme (double-stranded beta helix superfamily)